MKQQSRRINKYTEVGTPLIRCLSVSSIARKNLACETEYSQSTQQLPKLGSMEQNKSLQMVRSLPQLESFQDKIHCNANNHRTTLRKSDCVAYSEPQLSQVSHSNQSASRVAADAQKSVIQSSFQATLFKEKTQLLTARLQQQNRDIEQMKKTNLSLANEISRLKNRISELQRNQEMYFREKAAMEQTILTLRRQIDCPCDIESMKNKISELNKIINQQQRQMDMENKEQAQKIEDTIEQRLFLKELYSKSDYKSLLEKISHLENQIVNYRRTIDMQADKFEGLQRENATRYYMVLQTHEDLVKLQHDYDIKTLEANDNATIAEMYRQKLSIIGDRHNERNLVNINRIDRQISECLKQSAQKITQVQLHKLMARLIEQQTEELCSLGKRIRTIEDVIALYAAAVQV